MYLVSKKRSLILKCKTETRGWWCGDSRCGGSGFRPQYFSVLVLLALLGLLILLLDLVVVVVVNIKSGFQQHCNILVILQHLSVHNATISNSFVSSSDSTLIVVQCPQYSSFNQHPSILELVLFLFYQNGCNT